MMKSKLGISIGLLGAIVYFAGMMNFLALIIIAGYIFIAEDNIWVRKAAVKAIAIVLAFFLFSQCFNVLDQILAIPNYFIGLFDDSYDRFQLKVPFGFDSFILSLANLAEILVLGLCGIKALKQGNVKIAPIDKIADENVEIKQTI